MKSCDQWGFDLTSFRTVGPFLNVLDAIGAKHVAEKIDDPYEGKHYYKFIWKGPRVCLTTGYNPVTGETPYGEVEQGRKGYASYMGLTGKRRAVGEAVRAIRANAEFIKEESPHRRDFI